jgi:hypothetical protein
MHFDNQGQMNFLKQQNQAILQELQKRVEVENGNSKK